MYSLKWPIKTGFIVYPVSFVFVDYMMPTSRRSKLYLEDVFLSLLSGMLPTNFRGKKWRHSMCVTLRWCWQSGIVLWLKNVTARLTIWLIVCYCYCNANANLISSIFQTHCPKNQPFWAAYRIAYVFWTSTWNHFKTNQVPDRFPLLCVSVQPFSCAPILVG